MTDSSMFISKNNFYHILIFISMFCTSMQGFAQVDVPDRYEAPKVIDKPQDQLFDIKEIEFKPTFRKGEAAWNKYFFEKFREINLKKFSKKEMIVQFIVEKDGSLVDPKMMTKGIPKEIVTEISEIITSSPKWNPGSYNGRYGKVKYQWVINLNDLSIKPK